MTLDLPVCHSATVVAVGFSQHCQVCVRANGKTSAHLKSAFKMSTVCTKSNASSKTWTPLPDRFIDDHLVEMFPLFDQARL